MFQITWKKYKKCFDWSNVTTFTDISNDIEMLKTMCWIAKDHEIEIWYKYEFSFSFDAENFTQVAELYQLIFVTSFSVFWSN